MTTTAGRRARATTAKMAEKSPLIRAVWDFERDYIVRALAEHQGHMPATAAALGIGREGLWTRCHRLGIPTPTRLPAWPAGYKDIVARLAAKGVPIERLDALLNGDGTL